MRPDNKPTGLQAGFSLIEVLIATTVLSIGLLVIGAAFGQGLRLMANAPMHMAAQELARDTLDNMTTAIESGTFAGVADYNGELLWNGNHFTRRVVARNNGLAWDVEIEISYKSGGVERRHIQTSVITQNP